MQFYKWVLKNFSKLAAKNGDKAILIFRVIFDKPWKSAAEFVHNALKPLFFVQIVFITAESMSCIHIKQ